MGITRRFGPLTWQHRTVDLIAFPPMTTRRRFALLLGTMLGGFIVSALALRYSVETEKARNLSYDRQTRAKLLSFWVDTANRDLPGVTADWSESEAFGGALRAVELGSDPSGIRTAMGQASIAFLWSVRPDGTLAIRVGADRNVEAESPPLTSPDLRQLLSETPSPRFFSIVAGELYEICARRLKSGEASNWILVARHWSPEHLRKLSYLADGRVELHQPDALTLTEPAKGRVVLLRPLNDWQGKSIRVLRIECDTTEIEALFGSTWSQILIYLVFGISILIAISVALHSWVLQPLRLIQESLASENGTVVHGLSAREDEFGRVAKLVISAFKQQTALRSEIVERKRLQESLIASEAALKQSLDDRARLGRDLHDGVIQSLYAAGMGLTGVRAQLKSDQTEAASQLELTRGTLNETIRDVRNFIIGLEPEGSKDQLFSQAVESLIKSMRGMGRFDSTVTIDNSLAANLSLTQRANALQIAKEALSNALRHGKADHVRVTLQPNASGVLFEIADNGCGFDATLSEPHGKGLANFEQRARELGAELRVISDPGQGTRVELSFSLP